MTGPTFSPDGKWMWSGSEWIPAPPGSQVVPAENIDQTMIDAVASQTGIEPEHLVKTAPYFDANRDGELQKEEINQAANSLMSEPATDPPQGAVGEEKYPNHHPLPQPAPPQGMQQQVLPQPAPPQGMQQQALPQPAPPQGMQQQALAQPAPPQGMQQQVLPQPAGPQGVSNTHLPSYSSTGLGAQTGGGKGKSRLMILVGGLVFLLVSSTVLVVYIQESDLGQTEDTEIGLVTISYESLKPWEGHGASQGSNDVIGHFYTDSLDLSDQSFLFVEMTISINGATPISCSLYEGQYDSPECLLIWNWNDPKPSYSGASIYEDEQTGSVVDYTDELGRFNQLSEYCSRISLDGLGLGQLVEDHAFCDNSFLLVENGVNLVSSSSSIEVVFKTPSLSEIKEIDYTVGLLDYDSDGVDDFVDECPLVAGASGPNGCLDADGDGVADKDDDCPMTSSLEDVDDDGCSAQQKDQDNDGVPNSEDLLQTGNAGLRIYVSQLHVVEGEEYEMGQRWPCSDGWGSTMYENINDGVEDCMDGSDENPDAGEQGVNWRIPDFTYRLKVDWDCDEIYDENISMSSEGVYFQDVEYLNISLDAATQNGRVLSKDIADDLDSVCIAINVYDKDIVSSGDLTPLDVTEIGGTGQSFTLAIGSSAFDGDYTWTKQGSNDDDSASNNPDALVSIRFLIYEIES